MKLKPSYIDSNVLFSSPENVPDDDKSLDDSNLFSGADSGLINGSSSSSLTSIYVGGVFFILSVAAAFYYYQRHYGSSSNDGKTGHTTLLIKRSSPEKPLTLRKPSAVRSPGTPVGGGVILTKKTPSPTGAKTPIGSSDGEGSGSHQNRRRSNTSDSNDSHGSSSCRISTKSSGVGIETGAEVTEHTCIDMKSPPKDLTPSPQEGNISGLLEAELLSTGLLAHHGVSSSGSGGMDTLQILGKLNFRLKYNYEKRALTVTIERCSDLIFKESTHADHCDPYIKLQLLPEKQNKVKTRVLKKTRNPVYDEDFTFFGIESSQLQTTSLHFLVLSFDRFSRDKIIGEVTFELASIEFDRLEKQISLQQDILPRNFKNKNEGLGELLVSLCYQPAANRLTVVVLKARNLPKMDITGACDPYVKIYLMYKNQRISKKKTHIKKRTLNPVFNESFVFDVPYHEGLENLSLDFMLLDYERVTKNEVIGKLTIGPEMMVSSGSHSIQGGAAPSPAAKHWMEVAAKPRRQIAEWHKLKPCE